MLACNAPAAEIVTPIGLTVADLFPAGHKYARRLKIVDARRRDFAGNARALVNALKALEDVGAYWDIELRCDCAHCGAPAALLRVSSRYASLSCPGDTYADELGYAACTLNQFQQALAGRLHDQKEDAA